MGGRGQEGHGPHFNFQTRQGSTVSVSNVRAFRNYMDEKFHDFYHVCYNFWAIYGSFHFFLTTWGKQITSCWTFWKGPILSAGPSAKVLIVDHPKEDYIEREFKCFNLGRILNLLKSSSETRGASIQVVHN